MKKGHDVTILTGIPNYPQGKIYKGYRFGKRCETIDGVKVIRCFQFGRGRGKVGLMLNFISFAIFGSIKSLCISRQFDCVFCYQLSPITMALPAIVYKRRTHTQIFLYCLDIFPESILSHISKDGVLYRMVSVISRKIYNYCDCIAVTSKPFMEYLMKENLVVEKKIVYIPQHADADMLLYDFASEEDGIADFLFAGNVGYAQNMETVVAAVDFLKLRKDFKVHIVGDGSRLSYLKDLISQKHLESFFVFYGKHSKEKMPAFYQKADALLLTLRGDNQVGNTMPGKLQTYMTVGKPIIGAINGAAKEVIKESGAGICVDSGDASGLAKCMQMYICNPKAFENCGKNARNYYINHFTLDIYLENIIKELKQISKKKN